MGYKKNQLYHILTITNRIESLLCIYTLLPIADQVPFVKSKSRKVKMLETVARKWCRVEKSGGKKLKFHM